MSLIQILVLAVVALILGIFVVRPLLLPSRRAPGLPAPGTDLADGALNPELPVLNGTIEPDDGDMNLPVLADASGQGNLPTSEDAVARLRTLIEERRSETVEVLRSWLDEPKPEDAR